MKTERSDVKHPLWRKKVDSSLFQNNGTTIPNWECKEWNLGKDFLQLGGKIKRNQISVMFEGKQYCGWITSTKPEKRKSKAFRFYYEEDVTDVLKTVFRMSYMRDLEGRLRHMKVRDRGYIEKEIPFWEFLDLEYDSVSRICYLTAYYTQQASFTSLFQNIIGSPTLKRIGDDLFGKKELRIYKSKWKVRKNLKSELPNIVNVVYILADRKNKLVYVGEAENLQSRLKGDSHQSIKNWTHYKYSALSNIGNKSKQKEVRIAIERMLINEMASMFKNTKNISSLNFSDYTLTNRKIDAD